MNPEEIERIIALRKERNNYRQIATKTNYSVEWIAKTIAENAPHLKGDLLYPELDRAETFQKPDEVIAAQLNLPVSSIASARRRFSKGNRLAVNLARRRKSLAQTLFNLQPGPNFIKFLDEQLFPRLTPLQRSLMENFYIWPSDESLAAANNFDSERSYRTEIKAELVSKVKDFTVENLLQEGILKYARNGRSKSN